VLEDLASAAEKPEVREYAFQALIERQHRPTIERCLSQLLKSDSELSVGEVERPGRSPLDWISKIKNNFAWDKLAKLRGISLQKSHPMVTALLTDTLARIDRAETAKLVYRQIELAPPAWRHIQQGQAIRLETEARVEKAQTAPLARVLERLRGATSLNLLLVFCEGSTDILVFKTLLNQIRDDVRSYFAKEIKKLLSIREFNDALPGYVPPDAASQERVGTIISRLEEIGSL
jgi:hypothetical protein